MRGAGPTGVDVGGAAVLLHPNLSQDLDHGHFSQPGWGGLAVDGCEELEAIGSNDFSILLTLRFAFWQTIAFKPLLIAINPFRRNVRAQPFWSQRGPHV